MGLIKTYLLNPSKIEYQNINFTVVIISHNYLPIALGLNIIILSMFFELFMSMSIHNHENYRKNLSLKMLLFHNEF